MDAYDEEPYYDHTLFKPRPRISGPGPRQSTNAQASGSRQHTITQPEPVSGEKSASSQTRNAPASSTVDTTSSTTAASAPVKLPTKKSGGATTRQQKQPPSDQQKPPQSDDRMEEWTPK